MSDDITRFVADALGEGAEHGLRTKMDEILNDTSTDSANKAHRIALELIDENGYVAGVMRRNPLIRYAFPALGAAAGRLVTSNIDVLLPGNDANTRKIKLILKTVVPGLTAAAGESVSDALWRQINEVDGGVNAADGNKVKFAVWPDEFGRRYFPIQRAEGNVGDIVTDDNGWAVVLDLEFQRRLTTHLKHNPPKKQVRKQGRGGGTETIISGCPFLVVDIDQYLTMLAGLPAEMRQGFDLDELRELRNPSKPNWFAVLDDDVVRVRQAARLSRRSLPSGELKRLIQAERKVDTIQPNPERMKQVLAPLARFIAQDGTLNADALKLYQDALDELDEDRPMTTTVDKVRDRLGEKVEEALDEGGTLGALLAKITLAVGSATTPFWIWLAIFVFFILVWTSGFFFNLSVTIPMGDMLVPVAFLCHLVGIIGIFFECLPLGLSERVVQLTARFLGKSEDEVGLKSFGRRAIIFALSAGAVVTYLSAFGVASGYRALVLLVFLMLVAPGMLVSEIKRPDLAAKVEEQAVTGLKTICLLFATHLVGFLVWYYLFQAEHGPFMDFSGELWNDFVELCKQFIGVLLAATLVPLVAVAGFVIHRWGETNTPDGLYRRSWVKPLMGLTAVVFLLLAFSIVFERDGGWSFGGDEVEASEPSQTYVVPVPTSGKGSGGLTKEMVCAKATTLARRKHHGCDE